MRMALTHLPPVIAGVFAIGLITGPGVAVSRSTGHVYTGKRGDVFQVPSAATRCVVSAEVGASNVICSHTPAAQARYEVVFYRDALIVYRSGNPDKPVFSTGKP